MQTTRTGTTRLGKDLPTRGGADAREVTASWLVLVGLLPYLAKMLVSCRCGGRWTCSVDVNAALVGEGLWVVPFVVAGVALATSRTAPAGKLQVALLAACTWARILGPTPDESGAPLFALLAVAVAVASAVSLLRRPFAGRPQPASRRARGLPVAS